MSNIQLVIEERPSLIGNFMVGRLLPFREKRLVGPFCFIDHMGPVDLSGNANIDIGPHPHIGLSTLTFLFEGSITHRDSLGSVVEIKPGQVNWMTAGKGIVHSERMPVHAKREGQMHGLQIWVALPKHLEQMDPEFFHIEAADIPSWEEKGAFFKLIAGEVLGHRSPVPVYSPLYLLEIRTKVKQTINLGSQLFGESGLYILEGAVESEGSVFGPKNLLVAKEGILCEFTMEENTSVYIFGGEPFPEERFIYWNFVASDKALIEEAKRKWVAQEFDHVPGETDYIPLPAPIKPIK